MHREHTWIKQAKKVMRIYAGRIKKIESDTCLKKMGKRSNRAPQAERCHKIRSNGKI